MDNIIRGLRPDVQRLTRTKAIPTVGALTTFIKQVFGANDVMYARKPIQGNNERFQQRRVNELRIESQNDNCYEEEEEDFEDYTETEDVTEIHALSKTRHTMGKQKTNKAEGREKPNYGQTKSFNTSQKPVNDESSSLAEIKHQQKNVPTFNQNKLTPADLHCKNCSENGHFWRDCKKDSHSLLVLW